MFCGHESHLNEHLQRHLVDTITTFTFVIFYWVFDDYNSLCSRFCSVSFQRSNLKHGEQARKIILKFHTNNNNNRRKVYYMVAEVQNYSWERNRTLHANCTRNYMSFWQNKTTKNKNWYKNRICEKENKIVVIKLAVVLCYFSSRASISKQNLWKFQFRFVVFKSFVHFFLLWLNCVWCVARKPVIRLPDRLWVGAFSSHFPISLHGWLGVRNCTQLLDWTLGIGYPTALQ